MPRLNDTMRNAMIGVYETTIGAEPRLQLRSGAVHPTVMATAQGALIEEITLPSDWVSVPGTPSAGSVSKVNNWVGNGADNAGIIGHYRLLNTGGTCFEDGSVSVTGGGGDLTVDNTNVTALQVITITSWVRTQGGA